MANAVGKRVFDITCSLVGIVVLLPLGIIAGAIIKLSDWGPIFYRQTRIGQFGKPFCILKFRSMVCNADKMGVLITKGGDPRITRFGKFLRRTKFDELPQLWNVLIGEMSFVGPRPEVLRYVQLYTREQRKILNYKPGITDMATMMFRNEEALLSNSDDIERFYLKYCLPKKIELNQHYGENANLLQDIWIIIQTLCPYWLGVLFIYAVGLVAGCWLSYQLRFDFRMNARGYDEFKRSWPIIVLPQLALLFWRGQVRGMLSYFSIPEMRHIAEALAFAFCLEVGLSRTALNRHTPLSLLITNLVLSFFALCAVRMAMRLLREYSTKSALAAPAKLWRIAIVGTGEAATNLVLNLRRRKDAGLRVVAFFDDNPHTWNKRPHNVPVIGMPECLLNPDWRLQIDEVIVTVPENTSPRNFEVHDMLKSLPMKVTFVTDLPRLKYFHS